MKTHFNYVLILLLVMSHAVTHTMQPKPQMLSPILDVSENNPLRCYFRKLALLPHGHIIISELNKLEEAKNKMLVEKFKINPKELEFEVKCSAARYNPSKDPLLSKNPDAAHLVGQDRRELDKLCHWFCIDPTTIQAIWIPETNHDSHYCSGVVTVGVSPQSSIASRKIPQLHYASLGHELGHLLFKHGLEDQHLAFLTSKNPAAFKDNIDQLGCLNEYMVDIVGASGHPKYIQAALKDFLQRAHIPSAPCHPESRDRAKLLGGILQHINSTTKAPAPVPPSITNLAGFTGWQKRFWNAANVSHKETKK